MVHLPHLFNQYCLSDSLLETSVQAGEDINGYQGVIFRKVDGDNFYEFMIDRQGRYRLRKLIDDKWHEIIDWTLSSALKPGSRVSNQLGVLAQGTQITLLINDTIVEQIDDDAFTTGDVALAAGSVDEADTTAFFRYLNIWHLTH